MNLRLLALLACAIACAPAGGGHPSPSPVGVAWRLARLGDQPARGAGDAIPSLSLASVGRASGGTGCNSYSGSYQLRGDSIRFGALISTRRACVDPEMNRQEAELMAALEGARRWRMEGDTLVLEGTGPGARFVRSGP